MDRLRNLKAYIFPNNRLRRLYEQRLVICCCAWELVRNRLCVNGFRIALCGVKKSSKGYREGPIKKGREKKHGLVNLKHKIRNLCPAFSQ